MNEDYYKYALELLDSLTLDEVEAKLKEHGFNARRRVPLYESEEFYSAGARADQGRAQRFTLPDPIFDLWAANDNSYALAA